MSEQKTMNNSDKNKNDNSLSTTPSASGNDNNKSKLKSTSEAIHDVKDIVETAISIHEKLGSPIKKGFGFLSQKIGKKNNESTKEKKYSEENKLLELEQSGIGNNAVLKEEQSHTQVTEENKSKELIESSTEIVVNDKDDPFTQLETLLSPTNIGESHEKALAKAIEAQLKVLSVVKTPTLLSSNYNLILSALNDSIALSTSEEEREKFRRNAGLMLHSLVFFQEAQLSYEEKNHDKESEALLEIAANELQESVTSVALAAVPVIGQGAAMKKIVMKVAVEKACSGIRNTNFMAKFLQLLFKKKKLEQQRRDFYLFLVSAFDKLNRYKKNFGKNQLVLSEMIIDYKSKIIPYTEDKTNELKILAEDNEKILIEKPKGRSEPGSGFVSKLIVVLSTIGVIVGFDGYLIQNYYNQSPAFVTLLSLSICFVMLVFDIVATWRINKSVKKAKREYKEYQKEYQKEIADYYYSKLAEHFSGL